MTPLVLYAVVEGALPKDRLGRGVGRTSLHVTRVGGLQVVFERAVAPAVEPKSLRAHDRVVRRLARLSPAVLPFRYGSVVADRARLTAIIEPIAPSLADALERVRGCVQFTLRVYGRAAPAPRPRRGGPGTRWLERRRRARTVPEIAELVAQAALFVRAERVERHDRPPLLASVYHLVPRADARRYRAAIRAASPRIEGVRIEASGPFAPYAFTEVG